MQSLKTVTGVMSTKSFTVHTSHRALTGLPATKGWTRLPMRVGARAAMRRAHADFSTIASPALRRPILSLSLSFTLSDVPPLLGEGCPHPWRKVEIAIVRLASGR